jgi:phosphoglycolate phosphatase
MSADESTKLDTVVLDVDGTLVDTVYQHTVIWAQAFASVDVDVPMWRLHRAIGMGGDRLVAEVAGDEVEEKYGDQVRKVHDDRFGAVIDEIRPLPGAADLLEGLRERGLKVALASSGIEEQTKRLLGLFGGEEHAHAWTSSDDVDASKPAPDLIQVAIDKVDGERALVIGDAVWDISAAEKAGLPSIGVRCGGFGEAELLDAGASQVYRDPQDLLDHLAETPLG